MKRNDRSRHFRTMLAHAGRPPRSEHGFVNAPLHRGSTVLFPSVAMREAYRGKALDQALVYGAQGGPTHHALEDVVAAIEGGTRSQIVSTGVAAVTTALFAYLRSGDHCLMPDGVYGPTRRFCETIARDMGIETTYYRPGLDASGVERLMTPRTRVIFAESPASHTMEMQDVSMLAGVAHGHGARLILDNTWGLHFFQPFEHGVDCSVQAATKYIAGHSDVMLGAITVATDADWERVRRAALVLGHYASPDDCWLALRGARTLAIRLETHMRSGLAVAAWLRDRPEIAAVLHPGLPGAPGHDLWRRDFTGACGLFTVAFGASFGPAEVDAFADALELFGIGASWGGFESLVLPTSASITRTAGALPHPGVLCRFHVGLEDPLDLIADLEQALARISSATRSAGHEGA